MSKGGATIAAVDSRSLSALDNAFTSISEAESWCCAFYRIYLISQESARMSQDFYLSLKRWSLQCIWGSEGLSYSVEISGFSPSMQSCFDKWEAKFHPASYSLVYWKWLASGRSRPLWTPQLARADPSEVQPHRAQAGVACSCSEAGSLVLQPLQYFC